MRSLFFSRCVLCGDPSEGPWWIGPDISAVPMFEVVPTGTDDSPWISPDLGTLHFTGYSIGKALVFRRDSEWLLLDDGVGADIPSRRVPDGPAAPPPRPHENVSRHPA